MQANLGNPRRAGRGRWFYNLPYGGDCWVCDDVWRFRDGPPNALRGWGAKHGCWWGVVFTIFIMVVIVGYVMTYGAFGT